MLPIGLSCFDAKGIECLPLILLDGEVVSSGSYPSRLELSGMTGLGQQEAAGHP